MKKGRRLDPDSVTKSLQVFDDVMRCHTASWIDTQVTLVWSCMEQTYASF